MPGLMAGAPREDTSKNSANSVDAGAVYVIHGTPNGTGTGSRIEGAARPARLPHDGRSFRPVRLRPASG
jgi:hypothetical protein